VRYRRLTLLALTALAGCADDAPPREPPDAAPPAAESAATPTDRPPRPAEHPVPDIRLTLDAAAPRVSASIELDLSRPAEVNLLFRMDFEGYPDLESRLVSLEAHGPSGAVDVQKAADGLGSGHYVIGPAPPGRLNVEYRLDLAPPDDSRLYHRVSQISADGGHLLGRDLIPRLWIGPPHAGPQPARVTFSGLPPDWQVATVEARAGIGYTIAEIVDAVFVVGPLRQRQMNLGHRSLVTAIYGRWPSDDARIFDAVSRITGTLNRLAGDGWARGDYLLGVGRVPATVPGWSTGGQVIGHSSITCTGGATRSEQEFETWLYTTAHELMHWYIPSGFPFQTEPPSWFAEGFTDYMALKTLLVAGLIQPQAFLDEIDFRWSRYVDSPLYGTASPVDAEENFWEEASYEYIYDGGALAAFLLDLGFQDRGGSLERKLRDLQGHEAISDQDLVDALASVRENEWIEDWLAEAANPDWEGRLEAYGLARSNDSLVSLNDWATNALSSIRP
jgi:predicted metalloprotease with PDZ domain